MKTLFIAALALFATAAHAETYSCDISEKGVCVEATAANVTPGDVAELEKECAENGGRVAPAACKDGFFASCNIPQNGAVVDVRFYSPLTLDMAQQICSNAGGTLK